MMHIVIPSPSTTLRASSGEKSLDVEPNEFALVQSKNENPQSEISLNHFINDAVMLSEAKHLCVFSVGDEIRIHRRFFAPLRMTLRRWL
jgi:hypothetical protein